MGTTLPSPGQPGPMQPGEFTGAPTPNIVTFGLKGIAPPSPLYVQRDDLLVLAAVTSLTGEIVTFSGRFLQAPLPRGGQPGTPAPDSASDQPQSTNVIVPINFQLRPLNTRALLVQSFALGEGYLLSLVANGGVAGATRGQTYVRANLLHGTLQTSPLQVAQLLLGDYTTTTIAVGWPSGRILEPTESSGFMHTVQQANPGAATDFVFTVPTNTRMRISSMGAIFTASATIANRSVELIVDDGANIYWAHSVPTLITANQVINVVATGTSAPVGVITTIQPLVIPPGLILPAGHRIRSLTGTLSAGDQWSAIWFDVEEYLDTI